ncbi:MAG: hypothetical protein FJZ90_03000 [Chloroflexi bacterium]|nr:hypothetical protein [Chloroflexota bacterium]
MEQQAIVTYKRFGFQLRVYGNRLEIEELGFLWLRKRQLIPFRNIANVERKLSNRIVVTTNDGKRRSFVCGLKTKAVYEAILGAL